MLLYHGTAKGRLPAIMREGIKPRGRKPGNWKHTVESNPKAVYLTDAYPAYFAGNVGTNVNGVILEIDTDRLEPFRLHPDEDALEQVGRGRDGIPGDMIQRTRYYRKVAAEHPGWELSLRAMGTCAYYGTVPPRAITRYVTIDWKAIPIGIKWSLLDTSVSMLNYQILADRHRAFTRWLFGDEVTPEQVLGFSLMANPDRLKHWSDALQKRQGLTVVEETRA